MHPSTAARGSEREKRKSAMSNARSGLSALRSALSGVAEPRLESASICKIARIFASVNPAAASVDRTNANCAGSPSRSGMALSRGRSAATWSGSIACAILSRLPNDERRTAEEERADDAHGDETPGARVRLRGDIGDLEAQEAEAALRLD